MSAYERALDKQRRGETLTEKEKRALDPNRPHDVFDSEELVWAYDDRMAKEKLRSDALASIAAWQQQTNASKGGGISDKDISEVKDQSIPVRSLSTTPIPQLSAPIDTAQGAAEYRNLRPRAQTTGSVPKGGLDFAALAGMGGSRQAPAPAATGPTAYDIAKFSQVPEFQAYQKTREQTQATQEEQSATAQWEKALAEMASDPNADQNMISQLKLIGNSKEGRAALGKVMAAQVQYKGAKELAETKSELKISEQDQAAANRLKLEEEQQENRLELASKNARYKLDMKASKAGAGTGAAPGGAAGTGGAAVKFSGDQYKAATFALRQRIANDTITALEAGGYDPTTLKAAVLSKEKLNALRTPEQQQYAQGMRNFINATLRRESGAAIAPSEFDSAYQQYFAKLGDSPEVLERKRQNRLVVHAGFKAEAAGAYQRVEQEYAALGDEEATPAPAPRTPMGPPAATPGPTAPRGQRTPAPTITPSGPGTVPNTPIKYERDPVTGKLRRVQ